MLHRLMPLAYSTCPSSSQHATNNNARLNVGVLALVLTTFYMLTQTALHTILETLDDEQNAATTKRSDAGLLLLFPRVRSTPAHQHSVSYDPSSSSSTSTAAMNLSQRERYEIDFPPNDLERIRLAVEHLRVPSPNTHAKDVPYDIYNCPPIPPPGYPHNWLLVDQLLMDWNVDNTTIPNIVYQSICVFDWDVDSEKAQSYRRAEVPFVVQNHPELLKASERWNTPNYLRTLIGPNVPVRTEYSKNNHLKFWRKPKNQPAPPKWEPPELEITMTFDDFLAKAHELAQVPMQDQHSREHWYMRWNAATSGQNLCLYEELPIFVPHKNHPSFFMIVPEQERGINCRLGMQGNVAELHFDPMRNFVVVMGGQRRYIVAPPEQCPYMELHPPGHPSARHSSRNFSAPPGPDYHGPFRQAQASELVVQAGDALYLPDSWFHFIVALSPLSYQCNVRSGLNENPALGTIIRECGFPMYAWPESARFFPEYYKDKIRALDAEEEEKEEAQP